MKVKPTQILFLFFLLLFSPSSFSQDNNTKTATTTPDGSESERERNKKEAELGLNETKNSAIVVSFFGDALVLTNDYSEIQDRAIDRIMERGLEIDRQLSLSDLGLSTGNETIDNSFYIGMAIGNKILPSETVHHDFDKVYYNIYNSSLEDVLTWNQYNFRIRSVLPITFSTAPYTLPATFYLSTRAEEYIDMSLTLPSNIPEIGEKKLWQAAWKRVKIGLSSMKEFKISLTPEEYFQDFPPGSKIGLSTRGKIVMRPGFRYALGIPFVHNDIAEEIALLDMDYERTYKTLFSHKKKLVKMTITSGRSQSEAKSMSVGVGITFFKKLIPEAKLSIQPFTTARSTIKRGETVFEYIYDLDYPEALEAFRKSFFKNLIPTQDIATTSTDVKNYKGVLTHHVLKRDTTGIIRPYVLSTQLSSLEFSLNFGDLSRISRSFDTNNWGFFHYVDNAASTDVREVRTNSFGMTNVENRFLERHFLKEQVLFGTVSDYYKTLDVNSYLKRYPTVTEDGEKLIVENRLDYHFTYLEKEDPEDASDFFLKEAIRTLSVGNPKAADIISEKLSKLECDEKAEVRIRAAFYNEALQKVARLSADELWNAFAQYIDAPEIYAKLDDRYSGRSKIKPSYFINKDFRDYFYRELGRCLPTQSKFCSWCSRPIYKKTCVELQYKMLQAEELVSILSKENRPDTGDSDKIYLAKKLRDYFIEDKENTALLSFLVYLLNQGSYCDKDPEEYFQGIYVDFVLEGINPKHCYARFTQYGTVPSQANKPNDSKCLF